MTKTGSDTKKFYWLGNRNTTIFSGTRIKLTFRILAQLALTSASRWNCFSKQRLCRNSLVLAKTFAIKSITDCVEIAQILMFQLNMVCKLSKRFDLALTAIDKQK